MIISILASLGLVALLTPKIFEAICNPHDHVERDEWAVADWQDLHECIKAWEEEQ